MATPDEIFAAGLMAKLTGSVLKRVDENTTQMPASGPAMRIDPMAVIRNQAIDPQKKQLLEQVNAAAEAAYPLPSPAYQAPQQPTPPTPNPQQEFNFDPPRANALVASEEVATTLKSIDSSIKRLLTLLEAKWQKN
jgi:hypothetical protein